MEIAARDTESSRILRERLGVMAFWSVNPEDALEPECTPRRSTSEVNIPAVLPALPDRGETPAGIPVPDFDSPNLPQTPGEFSAV